MSKIHAYDSRLFECTFNPSNADHLYHDILSAGVHWVDMRRSPVLGTDDYVTVPIPIQLRLLGKLQVLRFPRTVYPITSNVGILID